MTLLKSSHKKNIIHKKKTIRKKNIRHKKKIGGNGFVINNSKLFTPYMKFRPLFVENKEKIFMPPEQIGIHHFKEHAFDKIRKKIEASYVGKSQQDIEKKVFLLFVKYLEDTIRYVSFDEYLKALEKVSQEIKEKILDSSEYQTIILCAQDKISKSNFWVLLLCLTFLDEDIRRVIPSKTVYVSNDISEAYAFFKDNPKKTEINGKVAFIYFDDMSYSGEQISMALPINKDDNQNDIDNFVIFLCVSFISSTAINGINVHHTVSLFDSTIKVKSNKEQIVKWCSSNESYIVELFSTLFHGIENGQKKNILSLLISCIYARLCGIKDTHNYKSNVTNADNYNGYIKKFIRNYDLDEEKKQILLAILAINNKKSKAFYCYDSLIPIYFDHKVADGISTFQKFLRLGEHPTANDNDFESMLENCDVTEELKTKYKIDKRMYVSPEDECPKTFYKKLEYTLEGKVLNTEEHINAFFYN